MRRGFLSIGLVIILTLLYGPQALTLADTEFVQNGSFEVDSDGDGLPDAWRGHHLGPNDKVVADPYVGEHSFQMTGEQGVNKALRQIALVDLPLGTDMIFEAFAKTDHESREGGLFAYKIILAYREGGEETILLKFRPRREWQSRGFERILRDRLQSVSVSIIYNNQFGTAWFDSVRAFSRP